MPIKLINHSDVTMYHNLISSMPKNLHYKGGEGYLSAFSTKRVVICFTPVNPQPQTATPQPQTLDPQTSTLNPQPLTPDP